MLETNTNASVSANHLLRAFTAVAQQFTGINRTYRHLSTGPSAGTVVYSGAPVYLTRH